MTGRDTVIAAGLRAFSRRGYHSASIREIARESGNSMSVLYHYFSSKDELFLEIVRISADQYFAVCENRLASAGPHASDQLRALVEATIGHRLERRAEANLLAAEIHVLPDELQQSVRTGWRQASRIWDDVIAHGLETGEFTTPFPIEARRGIVAMCDSVRDWSDIGTRVDQHDVVQRLCEFSLAIVGAHPGSPVTVGGTVLAGESEKTLTESSR
ncbi:MAG: hypothetical protein QOH68_4092 [Nocardioidaceae bacterium]|jgi:AcrR family transcriptional regulator|nr:hypothetical protein [Nocardioidaceae bacterium]